MFSQCALREAAVLSCCTAGVIFVQVTVVLKHLFTPDEAADAGSAFATEMEADVTAECKKLGTIEKVSTLRWLSCRRIDER